MFLLHCCLCGVINDDDRGDGLCLVLWHLETFYVFECSEWPRKVNNTQRYVYDSKARVVQQHKTVRKVVQSFKQDVRHVSRELQAQCHELQFSA